MVKAAASSYPAAGPFFIHGGENHAILGEEHMRTLRRTYRAIDHGPAAAVLFGELQTGGLPWPCYETRQEAPHGAKAGPGDEFIARHAPR